MLRIVTNELRGILDAWGEACEWLTVRKICSQRHCGEGPFLDIKLWISEGHSCAWMTSPDRVGMHRCRKLGAQDPGKGDGWDTTKALLTTSYSPHPQLRGLKTHSSQMVTFDLSKGVPRGEGGARVGVPLCLARKKKILCAYMGCSFCQKPVDLIAKKCILE